MVASTLAPGEQPRACLNSLARSTRLTRIGRATMQFRKLGATGIDIAPLVLGGNVFGWTADRETSFAILDAFLDAGFNAIDTADVYSIFVPGHIGGESETVIGEWMKDRGVRDRIVLITKGGLPMGEELKGLGADYLPRAVEASLKRLQTDRPYRRLFRPQGRSGRAGSSDAGDISDADRCRQSAFRRCFELHRRAARRSAGRHGCGPRGLHRVPAAL